MENDVKKTDNMEHNLKHLEEEGKALESQAHMMVEMLGAQLGKKEWKTWHDMRDELQMYRAPPPTEDGAGGAPPPAAEGGGAPPAQ